MGFSVHQPAVGAQLQFFPPMGSQQLDEMIDAYVPGNASILDKRAAVTCEFFHYSNATGELFKFFMVFPSRTSESFESPISLNDSGYGSQNTSPVMSENQWASASTSKSQARSSPKKPSVSDFSHLPGMKIMTKDGLDVTNSASRGCKTKEQRNHAHLMRIIKACDSCRRKKVRCDPSHKKRSSQSQSPDSKASKKVKKASIARQTASASVSQETLFSLALSADVNQSAPEPNYPFDWSMSSLESIPADEVDIFAETESWDQFINYGDESAAVHNTYDFNAHQSSPTSTISTNTNSPSLPVTPNGRGLGSDVYDFAFAGEVTTIGRVDNPTTFANDEHAPALPYLNPGGAESGANYVDFNLYSPSSSEADFGSSNEIAAASPDQQGFGCIGRDQLDESYGLWSEHRHRVDPNDRVDVDQNVQSIRVSGTSGVGVHVPFASRDASAVPMSSVHGQQTWSSSSPTADAHQDTVPAHAARQRVPAGNQPIMMSPHAPPTESRASGISVGDDRESPDRRHKTNYDLRRRRTLNAMQGVKLRSQTIPDCGLPYPCRCGRPTPGRKHVSTSCIACRSHAPDNQPLGNHVIILPSPLPELNCQPGTSLSGSRYRLDIKSPARAELLTATERGTVFDALPTRDRTPERLFTERPGNTASSQHISSDSTFDVQSALDEASGMSMSTMMRQQSGGLAAIQALRPDTNHIRNTVDTSSSSSLTSTALAGSLAIQSMWRRRSTALNSRDVSHAAARGVCDASPAPMKSSSFQMLSVYCSGLATLVLASTVGMQSPSDGDTAFFAIATVATLAVLCRALSSYADAKLADKSTRPLSHHPPVQDTRAYDSTHSSTSFYGMARIAESIEDLTSQFRRSIAGRGLPCHWLSPTPIPVRTPASPRQGRRSLGGIIGAGIQHHSYLHSMSSTCGR